MREKPVTIEVRKAGQHWAVYAEEQLVTQTVYEKGAQILEALLRGCLRYSSRKFFRLALSQAMEGPKQKPAAAVKSPKADKADKPQAKATPAEPKAKKATPKKAPAKAESAPDPAPAKPGPAVEAPSSEPATVPVAPAPAK
jgi:hypothetical protein